jgi:phospholipase C
MNFRYTFSLTSLTATSLAVLCIMLMAGCRGLTNSGSPGQQGTSFQLTVTPPPAGEGTITSNPVAISCPGTCTASFTQNAQVTLTATPSSNFFFEGWSGGCSGTSNCSVTITAATTVGANFSAGFGLTVGTAGAGTGTVTSNPAGISCSNSSTTGCTATFAPNTLVTLSEAPATGSTFAGWSGGCTGTTNCSVALSAASSVTATFGGSLQSLNHIILLAQENRSLDHYFGTMLTYWAQNGYGAAGQTFDGLPQFNPTPGPVPAIPGCDPADPYIPPNGSTGAQNTTCIPDATTLVSSFSFHTVSVRQENQSPFWNEAHTDWNYNDPTGQQPAVNNGFVISAANDARQNPGTAFLDTNGIRAMGYYEGSDLNYYYFMASNFATSDRWFSPVMSRTQLNRMYMLSATSQGHAYPLAPPEQPLTATTIFEELQNAGITWKIYVNPEGTGCSSTDSACLIGFSYINMFNYEQTILASPALLQNIVPVSQFTTDAQNGTLPQFALIEPASNEGLDEHPADTDEFPVNVQAGANYISGLINTLMTSQSWTDSALIFTYDEDGGYYDHVSPQPAVAPDQFVNPIDLQTLDVCDAPGELGTGTCDFKWTGYRVPLIVISPYSAKNFVSHTVRDHTAVLKMVETRFGLAALTARDAAQASMDEFFDYVNKPWATPPTPPVQVQTGQCTLTPPASWGDPTP